MSKTARYPSLRVTLKLNIQLYSTGSHILLWGIAMNRFLLFRFHHVFRISSDLSS